MIEIIAVHTAREIREFIGFPLRLYHNSHAFVPFPYREEKKLLMGNGRDDAFETVFYLAKKDGKTVGRIQGILPKKNGVRDGELCACFARFDCVNDPVVSRALFVAVETWARDCGAVRLAGPRDCTDTSHPGLLIDGFEEKCTNGEQYNAPYYVDLLADYGFARETNFFSYALTAPEKKNEMLARVARRSLELGHLHVASTDVSKREYLEKYADSLLETVEICFGERYGNDITAAERREWLTRLSPRLNIKYTVLICDEKERVVGFGLALPRIDKALRASGGRMTLPAVWHLRRAVQKPRMLDLVLMGVRPEYRNAGINAVIVQGAIDMLSTGDAKMLEISMNSEADPHLMAQWKYLTVRRNKQRCMYVKEIR